MNSVLPDAKAGKGRSPSPHVTYRMDGLPYIVTPVGSLKTLAPSSRSIMNSPFFDSPTISPCMVFLFNGQVHQAVDAGGDVLLVLESVLESLERGRPFSLRGRDSQKLDLSSPLDDMVKENLGVNSLFLGLDFHPVGKPFQVLPLEPG